MPSADPTVLRRKIAAHMRPAPPRPDSGAAGAHGFVRALRHAAAPYATLGLLPGTAEVTVATPLETAIAALPDPGLVAAIEDGAGRRGLIGLSAGLVDALVEVQTIGRVEVASLPPRPVTRIDEALVRDFVDLVLAAFAAETAGLPARDWPDRMLYGSRIRDRAQITLLLPEGGHVVFAADMGFAGVDRRARMVLALPVTPQPAVAPPVAATPPDPGWIAARARLIDDLPLPLDAVLLRTTRPLAEVERLAVGDLIPFAPAALAEVRLEPGGGRALMTGRLGQAGGRRALRLPGPAATAGGGGPGGWDGGGG